MINSTLAKHLTNVADLKQAAGHNVYAVIAYKRAAGLIKSLPFQVSSSTEFMSFQGIGDAISQEISDWFEFGELTPSVIKYSASLENGYKPRAMVELLADKLKSDIHDPEYKMDIVGSIRRKAVVCRDIDIITTMPHDSVKAALEKCGYEIIYGGDVKIRVAVGDVEADIRFCQDENYVTNLLMFTGSKSNNITMRATAKTLGMTLTEWGLFKIGSDTKIDGLDTEKSIYEYLGMRYLEPENR